MDLCGFFFFQAEDGIRDVAVTGVQTCALPISDQPADRRKASGAACCRRRLIGSFMHGPSPSENPALANVGWRTPAVILDRKSTRLNSSHGYISYAVFCLKKKKRKITALSHRYF